MSYRDESHVPISINQQDDADGQKNTTTANSMQEFYQLYRQLLVITLALIGIIFISVWIFYSMNIALNYLLGACAGVLYLRMLAKDVEGLSEENQSLSKNRLALVAVLIIVASQWQQLKILPIFLGFLTYKATLLVYMLQIAFISDSK